MSLKNKAAKITLDDLDASSPPQESESRAPVRARSGVGAISHSISQHHRIQDLEAELTNYANAKAVVSIDPQKVRQSRWKNRHDASWSSPEFQSLKAEIASAGGNVQPIKVRRVQDGVPEKGAEYEIVYGRRRLRACLELGIPVSAVVEQLDDLSLFKEMDRENRNRADLSPWEQGMMYRDALEQGLFTSQRQLAATLEVDQSNLGKALRLAALPVEVVEAFPSPLELQVRWGTALADALEKDPAGVLSRAEELRARGERPSAKEVFTTLLAVGGSAQIGQSRSFDSEKVRKAALFVRDKKGALTIRVKSGVLSETQERKLTEFLAKLLA